MLGLIFTQLKQYVDTTFGGNTWEVLLQNSGLSRKVYMSAQYYPDQDVLTVVSTASTLTKQPIPELLAGFGEFIAPSLIYMYPNLIDPAWQTLDLIEHTEHVIHDAVRQYHPQANPPEIKVTRLAANMLTISYNSPRKLCPLGKGIIRGIAKYFNQQVDIREQQCMLDGAASCELDISV